MDDETLDSAAAVSAIKRESSASNIGGRGRLTAMRLLELAERWLDLAERAHQITDRFMPSRWQHPLLRSKLGDEKHPDAE
jgi:hypothetical protein